MQKIFSLMGILVFCICFYVSAQVNNEERYLEVRGTSELDMQPLPRATANLYEGTTRIKSIETGSDGRFSFRLEINKEYTIVIEKSGLVSKRISFNTTMPDEEKGAWMNEFSIGLVKYCDGVDYSVLQEPVDKVKFDTKRREYVSDKDYVNKMRPRIENILTKYDECMMNKYDNAINKGDQLFSQKKYPEALSAYNEALEVYPKEEYPAKRISEINAQMSRQQDTEEAYKKTIAEADVLASQQNYTEALRKYKSATALKPQEAYPRQKAGEIESAIAKQQAEKQGRETIEEKYNQAMAKASVAYTKKDYSTARQCYQEALTIKPDESLPKMRVNEIEEILTKQAEEAKAKAAEMEKKAALENQYKEIITKADELFKTKSYDEAKAAYAQALEMRPSDSYPAQRVKTIDNMVAAEQAAKIKAIEEEYKSAISSANNALSQKSYPQAIEFLQKALVIKPEDPFATKKIAEIEGIIAEQQKLKEQEELLQIHYREAIAEADRLYEAKDLSAAKIAYNKALQIKPEDSYASQKIADIDKLIKAEAAEKQKNIENAYSDAMTQGTSFMLKKEYINARDAFQRALSIKPADVSAQAKINEVEQLIKRDQELASAEQERKSKYDAAIQKADQYFQTKDFSEAKSNYEIALTIMPGEFYPRQRIDVINKTLEDQERQLEEKQANDKAYNLALSNAERYRKSKDYYKARDEYKRALSLKPDEELPKNKLSEVEDMIRKLEEEQASNRARADAYSAAMNLGNSQFAAKDYIAAKSSYNEALKQMPNDNLAQEQIDKIDYLLSEIEKQKQAELSKKAAYDALILSADNAFNDAKYNIAREDYKRALTIDPANTYPKQKIARIDEIIRALSKNTATKSVAKEVKSEAPSLGELNFKNESERQKYFEQLKSKYPPGISLEKYKDKYREVLRYVIIRDNQAHEFRQVTYLTFNGAAFSMDGKPITQQYFLSQVKIRQGESYQEIDLQ
jgi:tetratricopeptide (TPR) repeat protein